MSKFKVCATGSHNGGNGSMLMENGTLKIRGSNPNTRPRRWRWLVRIYKGESAPVATVSSRSGSLQDRFLFFLPTVWAKPVIWLSGILHFLVNVNENLRTDLGKFVLALCLLPVLKLHQFLAKIVFLLNERIMLRLYRKSIRLHGKKSVEEFGNLISDLRLVQRRLESLGDVVGNLG
jgi:hypothetical protein